MDNMLISVAEFEEREESPFDVEWAVNYRNKLYNQFENGEYCDFIQDRWELAKKSIGK